MHHAPRATRHAQRATPYAPPCAFLHADDDDGGLGNLADVTSADNLGSAAAALSDPTQFVEMEKGLTFVGMVGIKDPARPEVATSIIRCRDAGIRVIMITGDSAATARAIARDVNILEDEALVFEGSSFFDLEQVPPSHRHAPSPPLLPPLTLLPRVAGAPR